MIKPEIAYLNGYLDAIEVLVACYNKQAEIAWKEKLNYNAIASARSSLSN